MTSAVEPLEVDEPQSLWQQLKEDLRPFPRRAGMTWRVALLCALVTGAGMLFRIPEAAISCYLIIFLMKPDAVVNVGTGIGLLVLLFGIVAMIVWLVNLTIGSTPHIMLAIILSSFLLCYIGGASQLGEMGGVAALVIAFLLTLIVDAPFGSVASFAIREAWAMAAMPMVLMVAFNMVLGFSPALLLQDKLRARLVATANALEENNPEATAELRELLHEGNAPFSQQAMSVRLLWLVSRDRADQMTRDVRAGFGLMLAASALPASLAAERRAALAGHVRTAIAALDAGDMPPPPPPADANAGPAERALLDALAVLAGGSEPAVLPAPKTPFFAPDALTNPAYPRFALKTTLAAVICFLAYTAMDWQDIHTAMITCYVAALGTTGETVHKLALRIGGCLVGATLGLASILFVIPYIDDIGSLMVLVFAGCVVGAWVSSGPERISYAGVQIALAFLLTILQGFSPSQSLDTAWGRIVGILLGNFVVYIVFTQIWVAPVEEAVRKSLADMLGKLALLARVAPGQRAGAIPAVAAIEGSAGQAVEMLNLLRFEPRAMRPSPEEEEALRVSIAEAEQLNRSIWLSPDELSPAADRLDELALDVVAADPDGEEENAFPASRLPASLQNLQQAIAPPPERAPADG